MSYSHENYSFVRETTWRPPLRMQAMMVYYRFTMWAKAQRHVWFETRKVGGLRFVRIRRFQASFCVRKRLPAARTA